MPGRKLSPKDVQDRNTVANNLNSLIYHKQIKQIDIVRETGIPASTITGYVKARSLPTPENVEKLAKFFHVSKAEIDPRFATDKHKANKSDLDEMLDSIESYDGKPITDNDREAIRIFLEGRFSKK